MFLDDIKAALQADISQFDYDDVTHEVGSVEEHGDDYLATVFVGWKYVDDHGYTNEGEEDFEVTVEVKGDKVTHDLASCLESAAQVDADDRAVRRAESGHPQ